MIKEIKSEIKRFIDEHFLIPMAFKKTSKLKIMNSTDSIQYIIVRSVDLEMESWIALKEKEENISTLRKDCLQCF